MCVCEFVEENFITIPLMILRMINSNDDKNIIIMVIIVSIHEIKEIIMKKKGIKI